MKKRSKFAHSALSAGGVGLVVAIGTILLFSLLMPYFVLAETIQYDTAMILVPAFLCASSFGCAVIAGKITCENKVSAICIGVGLYLLITICCGLLFFDGFSENALVGLPAIMLGGSVGLYISVKKVRSKRQKGRHRKNR